MTLHLSLTGGGTTGLATSQTLTTGSLSIGRSAGNDWVLPDSERLVSKTHCIVAAENGRFVLTDLSANGIYVNDAQEATSRNSRIVLRDGDTLRIGNYVIAVAEVDDRASSSPDGAESTDGPAHGIAAPVIDPLSRKWDGSFQHPIAHVPGNLRGEDPFDMEARRDARGGEPDGDLLRGSTPAGSWQGPPQSDHVPLPAQAVPPIRVIEGRSRGRIDVDALIGDLVPNRASIAERDYAGQPPAASIPCPQAQVPALDPSGSATPMEPTRPVRPPTAGAADARAALAAFLKGAGVQDQRIDESDPAAALCAAGKIFRAMTEGIRELLISRAAIKAEMGILQTIIRSEGSNALKFSITADDAVASLLAPGRPGYMDPLAAAQEAVEDIKLHELAVIVGMRNALEALLRRFDPTALEQRMAKENLLEAVLPSARKARYWDAFRVVYRDISRETENDFQSKFGRSFAEAYMTLARKDSEQNQ